MLRKKDAMPANRPEAEHRTFTSYARALSKRPTWELFHSPAQELANFFSRGSQSKYWGHTVSVANTPVCGCSVNAAPDPLCPIKLFTKAVAIPLTWRDVPVVNLLFLLGPRLGEAGCQFTDRHTVNHFYPNKEIGSPKWQSYCPVHIKLPRT